MGRKKIGDIIGNYTIRRWIGGGGNGEVWEVVDEYNNKYALKFLKNSTFEKNKGVDLKRFKNEVNSLKGLNETKGIIKIIDYKLGGYGQENYYVMPVAKGLFKHFEDKSIEDIFGIFIEILEALKIVHEKGLSHRDIKPDNLLFLDKSPVLADFGLVKIEGQTEKITENGRKLGAEWTIAPEMKRDPENADGKKADIYSIMKTLRIFITKEEQGFDGIYDKKVHGNWGEKYKEHIYILDDIFYKCTLDEPKERYEIDYIIDKLHECVIIGNNYGLKNINIFKGIASKYGSGNFTLIFDEFDDIFDTLNSFSVEDRKEILYLYFQDGGSLPFEGIKINTTENNNIIELLTPTPYLIKPKRLIYESFANIEFGYFILENYSLEPSGIYNNHNSKNMEELALFEDGNYGNRKIIDESSLIIEEQNAELIVRILEKQKVYLPVKMSIFAHANFFQGKISNEERRDIVKKIIKTVPLS